MRKIFEFNPVIFPTRVWITTCTDVRIISRKFYALDDLREVIEKFPTDTFIDEKTVAQTTLVLEKKSNIDGCLVTIHRIDEVTPGLLAHEANHCGDWLCEQFGIYSCTFETGETKSYYILWVTDCIWDVLTKTEGYEIKRKRNNK